MKPLRIVFAGTPEFGLPCLQAIQQSPHHLLAVYTQPDRPAGRGRQLHASAVKQWGQSQQIPVYQPEHLKDQSSVDTLLSLEADVVVVIAYGLILPKRILDIPTFGCINVHASLLPRWRGASPIQQAILAGDKESGVTIMQMDVGMDTGDMLSTASCPLDIHETAGSLHDKLALCAVAPLMEILNRLSTHPLQAIPQVNAQATYARKITKEDALIDWTEPAHTIDRRIRAFNPWPIAYSFIGHELVKIHRAEPNGTTHDAQPGALLSFDKQGLIIATGDQALKITQVQFAGSKVLSIADCLNSGRKELLERGFS